MPLLKLKDFESLLICPSCRHPLVKETQGYCCTNTVCNYSCPKGFSIVGDWPVLVDFTQSVLEENAIGASTGGSLIARSHVAGLKRRLYDLLFAPNPVASGNIEQLIAAIHASAEKAKVLVVGGGVIGNGTQALYQDGDVGLIAFDIYGTGLTQFIADGHQIPLADASMDGVVIQAVLEHVLDPNKVVQEIYRVLKPNGIVYAETPFMQQVHEGPYDFTRFTDSGHRYLFRKFDLIGSGGIGGPGTQLLWALDYVGRSLFRSRRGGMLFKTLFFWVRGLDKLTSTPYAIDCASGVYFLGRKSERVMTPKDAVAYYQGAQRPSQ